jgi:uncharacterized protein
MMRSVAFATIAGGLLLASMGAALAASKPGWCTSQHSFNAAERTICATPSLWDLDHQLNVAYEAALRRKQGAQRSQLQDGQRHWLSATRNGCGANVGCLTQAYSDWIVTLGDL